MPQLCHVSGHMTRTKWRYMFAKCSGDLVPAVPQYLAFPATARAVAGNARYWGGEKRL